MGYFYRLPEGVNRVSYSKRNSAKRGHPFQNTSLCTILGSNRNDFGIKPHQIGPVDSQFTVKMYKKYTETYFSLAWLSEGTVEPFPLGNMLGS